MEIIEIGKNRKEYREFPEHHHGFWEIILNESGSGIMISEENEYPFSEGTIAVIPPYTPHLKKSKDGFRDRSVFLKNFRDIGKKGVKVFQDDEAESMKRVFDMVEYYCDKKNNSDDNVFDAITNVLGDLIYQVLVSYYNTSRKKDIRLEGVVETIHLHIADTEFDLRKTIEASGYSMGYFRKIFKEMTGQSPVTYMNNLRINHAKSFFQQYKSSRTIKDAAYNCGFSDPLYFSRVFKQFEGVSPQQYVQKLGSKMTTEDLNMLKMDTPEEYV